ncbi:MAG: hypothetical protein PVI78_02460 [Anaerolineales bacterium]|jgi:hypothetical protein
MTRSIILAAPARQLTKLLTGAKSKMIYEDDHPVWEDADRRRALLEGKTNHPGIEDPPTSK